MAPPIVYLHIGSPKTGTTYVQNVLWANRKALESAGVLLPGHYRYARVQATRDLLKWSPDESPEPPQTWARIAAEITRWSGSSAVFSMEFLCWASTEQVQHVIDSLKGSQVKVILTTRDLARLVPAQWQTAMRQRNTWTLDEYAAAVAGVSTGKKAKDAARHFWRRQDYGKILEHWAGLVGVDNITVVTVPPSGGDPDELWRRFCRASGLDEDAYATTDMSHESLGAASAEVMRRLNETAPITDMSMRSYQKSVNGALTRRVLAERRSQEPGLSLPTAHREWADREAARVIAEIEAVGATVIGDLDDLKPRPSGKDPVAPEQLPAEQLLAAAIDGLAGLSAEYAKQRDKIDELEAKQASKVGRVKAPIESGGIAGLKDTWRRRRPRK
jgi:hypothetical protein